MKGNWVKILSITTIAFLSLHAKADTTTIETSVDTIVLPKIISVNAVHRNGPVVVKLHDGNTPGIADLRLFSTLHSNIRKNRNAFFLNTSIPFEENRTLYLYPTTETFVRIAEYFLPYTLGYTALGF